MCERPIELGPRKPRRSSKADAERRFQLELDRMRREEARIWQECERLKEEFYRPRGLLGWLGYRTSVPGF